MAPKLFSIHTGDVDPDATGPAATAADPTTAPTGGAAEISSAAAQHRQGGGGGDDAQNTHQDTHTRYCRVKFKDLKV